MGYTHRYTDEHTCPYRRAKRRKHFWHVLIRELNWWRQTSELKTCWKCILKTLFGWLQETLCTVSNCEPLRMGRWQGEEFPAWDQSLHQEEATGAAPGMGGRTGSTGNRHQGSCWPNAWLIHEWIRPSRALLKRQHLTQAALANWALLLSPCLGSAPTHSPHPCPLSGPLPHSAPLIPVTALLYNTAQEKTEEEEENKPNWWLMTQTK